MSCCTVISTTTLSVRYSASRDLSVWWVEVAMLTLVSVCWVGAMRGFLATQEWGTKEIERILQS